MLEILAYCLFRFSKSSYIYTKLLFLKELLICLIMVFISPNLRIINYEKLIKINIFTFYPFQSEFFYFPLLHLNYRNSFITPFSLTLFFYLLLLVIRLFSPLLCFDPVVSRIHRHFHFCQKI